MNLRVRLVLDVYKSFKEMSHRNTVYPQLCRVRWSAGALFWLCSLSRDLAVLLCSVTDTPLPFIKAELRFTDRPSIGFCIQLLLGSKYDWFPVHWALAE